MTEFLLNELAGPTTPKQRECLTRMLTACEQACTMIDSEVTGLFDEGAAQASAVCEVGKTLCDIVDFFAAEAERAGIRVGLDRGDELPGLLVPSVALSRIVSNLLSNAIRYAGNGSEVTVSATWADSELLIAVADNGVGIPTEELSEMMQPRRRGRGVKAPGTGLGLSVIRNIVSSYGGVVGVKSARGQGVHVTISFGEEAIVPLSLVQAA